MYRGIRTSWIKTQVSGLEILALRYNAYPSPSIHKITHVKSQTRTYIDLLEINFIVAITLLLSRSPKLEKGAHLENNYSHLQGETSYGVY